MNRNPLAEALEMCKLSVIAGAQDEELGRSIGEAIRDPSAWQRVHDRMNVIGNFDGADAIRKMMESHKLPSPFAQEGQ